MNRSFHTDQFKRGRKATNGGLLEGKDQLFYYAGYEKSEIKGWKGELNILCDFQF